MTTYNPNLSEQSVQKILQAAKIKYHDLDGSGKYWFAKDSENHWLQIVKGETTALIYLKRRTYKDDLQMLSEFENSKYFTPICVNLETFELDYGPGFHNGWGGTREGAGRPTTGRKKRNFYITDEEETKLKTYLEELRTSQK